MKAFNENFLHSGVTKIVNWYLVGSVYPMEPYPEDPAAMIANSPWSGHYHTREVLWGYAHYGQFSKIGWQYLNGACGKLAGGGTFVTLKSPGKDYSVILETKNAQSAQNVTFNVSGGLSTGKLCVWRSDATEQFVQQAGIKPREWLLHHRAGAELHLFHFHHHRPAKGLVRQCSRRTKISVSVLRNL